MLLEQQVERLGDQFLLRYLLCSDRRLSCAAPAELLRWRRQMLDASLERSIVRFAHYHVHMAGIVVDQRLSQRRAIGGGRLVGLPFPYR